jgi:hypothetical protein
VPASYRGCQHDSDIFQPTWCPNGRYLAYARLQEFMTGSVCWLVVVSGGAAGRQAAPARRLGLCGAGRL